MPEDDPPRDPHEFVFELDLAIKTQVLEKLDATALIDLSMDVAPAKGGVYALYQGEDLVYVGKASRDSTESERSLRGRLNEHVKKISGRVGLSPAEMRCRFLTIKSDWFVWAAERSLIDSFNPSWNKSGFGNKDTGGGRDHQKPSWFDNTYPIDRQLRCESVTAGDHHVKWVLQKMKEDLPFTFRFGRANTFEEMVRVEEGMGMEDLLETLVAALGAGWQGTIFKSHMILKKKIEDFDHAVRVITHAG